MESGWDNTVRFDFPHLIQNCYSVDCNCFMADFYQAMNYIADKLKKSDDAAIYAEKRSKLISKINSILFLKKTKATVTMISNLNDLLTEFPLPHLCLFSV